MIVECDEVSLAQAYSLLVFTDTSETHKTRTARFPTHPITGSQPCLLGSSKYNEWIIVLPDHLLEDVGSATVSSCAGIATAYPVSSVVLGDLRVRWHLGRARRPSLSHGAASLVAHGFHHRSNAVLAWVVSRVKARARDGQI